LVTKKNLRTATIICNEPSDFITLNKENFERILGDHHKEEMEKKTNFFKQFFIF